MCTQFYLRMRGQVDPMSRKSTVRLILFSQYHVHCTLYRIVLRNAQYIIEDSFNGILIKRYFYAYSCAIAISLEEIERHIKDFERLPLKIINEANGENKQTCKDFITHHILLPAALALFRIFM